MVPEGRGRRFRKPGDLAANVPISPFERRVFLPAKVAEIADSLIVKVPFIVPSSINRVDSFSDVVEYFFALRQGHCDLLKTRPRRTLRRFSTKGQFGSPIGSPSLSPIV
jgi:hypothetical protein